MELKKKLESIKRHNRNHLPPIFTLSPLHSEFGDAETGMARSLPVKKFQTDLFIILTFYKPVSRLITPNHDPR